VAEGGGGAAAVMNSFSHVNGVDMVSNTYLMQTVLREKFKFGEGMIVTDWGSISNFEGPDIGTQQLGCTTLACVAERAAACLKAGTDQDLKGGYFGVKELAAADQPLPAALRLGFINITDVERAASRVLKVFFKVGRFDPSSANPYRQLPYSTIGSPAASTRSNLPLVMYGYILTDCLWLQHRAIARQAAAEATVLLENRNSALPMDLQKVKGLAIIGPSADANSYNASGYPFDENPNDTLLNYCGDYSSCSNCPPNHTVTITRGILNHLAAAGSKLPVFTAKGCNHNDTNTSGFAAALAAAQNPAVSHVVLAVGMSGTLEGEGNDLLPSRFPIGKLWSGLPGVQMKLVEQIAALGKVNTRLDEAACVKLFADLGVQWPPTAAAAKAGRDSGKMPIPVIPTPGSKFINEKLI
jgi:beta-glucosidase